MNLILFSLITLGAIGSLAAVILYFAAKKFYVFEDPRIDEVEAALPAANCGGCGFPGCRGFADACVKADTMDGLNCPVGEPKQWKSSFHTWTYGDCKRSNGCGCALRWNLRSSSAHERIRWCKTLFHCA
jgi:hypothetical protein